MKYRLKKDTIDAEAGELYQLGLKDTNHNKHILYSVGDPHGKGNYYKDDIMNFDEWFEEVKPREWWVLEKQSSISIYEDKEMAGHLNSQDNRKGKIIKVREVLGARIGLTNRGFAI